MVSLAGGLFEKLLLQAAERTQRQMSEMECWSTGVLEYWVLNPSLHYSITPILLYSSLSRCSEAIECNEAYEFFSAAC